MSAAGEKLNCEQETKRSQRAYCEVVSPRENIIAKYAYLVCIQGYLKFIFDFENLFGLK